MLDGFWDHPLGQISCVAEQPSWHCTFILYSITGHFPEGIMHLSTRCLESVIIQELLFSSWHDQLTNC